MLSERRKMLSEIFPPINSTIITVLVLICIWTTYCIHRLETDVIDLQTKLTEQEEKTKDLESKFESFQSHTNKEHERTWKSFANVRNNFIALGKGFHLDKEDFCPESECPEDYKKNKGGSGK